MLLGYLQHWPSYTSLNCTGYFFASYSAPVPPARCDRCVCPPGLVPPSDLGRWVTAPSASEAVWWTVTLAMIGKFGIAGSFAVIYVFSGELLPTVIRSQAMAVASFFAGLGLLFFPQILALVSTHSLLLRTTLLSRHSE